MPGPDTMRSYIFQQLVSLEPRRTLHTRRCIAMRATARRRARHLLEAGQRALGFLGPGELGAQLEGLRQDPLRSLLVPELVVGHAEMVLDLGMGGELGNASLQEGKRS